MPNRSVSNCSYCVKNCSKWADFRHRKLRLNIISDSILTINRCILQEDAIWRPAGWCNFIVCIPYVSMNRWIFARFSAILCAIEKEIWAGLNQRPQKIIRRRIGENIHNVYLVPDAGPRRPAAIAAASQAPPGGADHNHLRMRRMMRFSGALPHGAT